MGLRLIIALVSSIGGTVLIATPTLSWQNLRIAIEL